MGLNKPVGFPTAKLLKEKGFDEKCTSFYDLISSNRIDYAPLGNYNLTKQSVSIPTIVEVVICLYDKYGIWINVSITIQKKYYYQCLDITGKKDPTKNNYPSRMCKPGEYFNSPTEAYEAAIEYTLKNLI